MPARRCSICAINWPPAKRFEECPQCHEPTTPGRNLDPLPVEEAEALLSLAKFNEFYELTRGVPADSDADPTDDPGRAHHPLD